MLGTVVKCPNIIKNAKNRLGADAVCAYEGYEVLRRGVFTPDSGFDPLACEVRCRMCGHVFMVFPAPNYTEAEGGKVC